MSGAVGLFVTLEGGEGAGKSTQAALLVERLQEAGRPALSLREPGGTPLGDYLREWLKASHRPLTAEAELFLFAAARAELVRTVVRPALDAGKVVVLDRYGDSTTAYQGAGRGLDKETVRTVNNLASDGLQPHLTVLLDLPPHQGLYRTSGREDSDERRFEEAGADFHQRIREAYLRLSSREPERWLVLDASLPKERIAAQVWDAVAARLATV